MSSFSFFSMITFSGYFDGMFARGCDPNPRSVAGPVVKGAGLVALTIVSAGFWALLAYAALRVGHAAMFALRSRS